MYETLSNYLKIPRYALDDGKQQKKQIKTNTSLRSVTCGGISLNKHN